MRECRPREGEKMVSIALGRALVPFSSPPVARSVISSRYGEPKTCSAALHDVVLAERERERERYVQGSLDPPCFFYYTPLVS